MHSFRARNCAVAGCSARKSIIVRPSFTPPPAGIDWPRTVFAPLSCWVALKRKSPWFGCVWFQYVQPVRHRASSATSVSV
jgi:hypothetical protein